MSVPPEQYGQPQQPQPPQGPQQPGPPPNPQQPRYQQQYPPPQQPQQPHGGYPPQPPRQQAYGQQYPPPQFQYAQQPPPQAPRPPAAPRTPMPSPAVLLPFGRWLRDRSLRNWITVLFVALVVVPSFALVVFPDLGSAGQSSWTFALYFAGAWLLVLWISVRPPMVRPLMLAEVGLIGLAAEAPVAVWLEKTLHADTTNIFSSVFTVGLPEEFAKALPIAVLAYVHRNAWASLTPKDYLFLGAVSGLAFGAAEAVEYVTLVIPAEMSQFAGQGASPADVVLASITQGSWRFVTDPMSHAVWAGITGYFIGLGVRFTRHRVWLVGFGLLLTAFLHGFNDYVAGHFLWIVEIIVSVLLFVAYSQAGGMIEQDLSAAEQAARAQQPPSPVGGYAPYPPTQYPPAQYPPAQYPPAPYPPTQYPPAQYPGWPQPTAQPWNPAAGWGSSGFTPLPGFQRMPGPLQPPPGPGA